MRLSEFDYELPEELIAQRPLEDRAGSRLLVLGKESGLVEHAMFRDCGGYLREGDLLVMNNTRVTALRLFGRKESGGAVELLLLRETEEGDFWAMAKPAKRLKRGAVIHFDEGLEGVVLGEEEPGLRLIRFQSQNFREKLMKAGQVPLPPYITERLDDAERYQTVYASAGGSAAAPTAGLHFTDEILAGLRAKGVETAEVTLHVSLDTFRPVGVDNIDDHVMHGETCLVGEETARKVRDCKGRIIAVGTTTVRTLETFSVGRRELMTGERVSKLFIRPGYEFMTVDGMFTNFHLPRTTMLLMMSAMCGREPLLSAYEAAVGSRYRFLSFGDSMLVI